MGNSDLGVTRCGRMKSAVRNRFRASVAVRAGKGTARLQGSAAIANDSSQSFGVKNELTVVAGVCGDLFTQMQ